MSQPRQSSVSIAYGRGKIELPLDPDIADWEIIQGGNETAILDFEGRFKEAVNSPVNSAPLRQIVASDDTVVIVTSDGTRPVPNKLLIPAIVRHCQLQPDKVSILIGTGTHRPPSRSDLIDLLGKTILESFRVVCHSATESDELEFLGRSRSGVPVSMNKEYLRASKRIVLGFIEPHFFAGFSGGAKGICPAVCGMETINEFHSSRIIAHPKSDYGELEENPQQLLAREIVALAPPDFLVNVTLNSAKQVIGIYAGDYVDAHRVGANDSLRIASARVKKKYPLAVVSNSGYPLDQNLYQTVKGITTAARIVADGRIILAVSECSKGIPDDGNFAQILNTAADPAAILEIIADPSYKVSDRWQAQKLMQILIKARVCLLSELSEEKTASCKMVKVGSIIEVVKDVAREFGPRPPVAVIPDGPLTLPIIGGGDG